MLHRFLILTLCFLTLGCDETIDARQLEIDNGLFYKKGDNTPFSGMTENFSPGYRSGIEFSQVIPANLERCLVHFKKGTFHGSTECFAGDERIAIIDFRNGVKHGREAVWDQASGNLLYKADFKKGVKHGREIVYDRSGKNVIRKKNFSNGKSTSVEAWNSAGELTEKLNYSEIGIMGFSVNNGGTATYYDAEEGIVIRKDFSFKSNYEAPKWSREMRYFGDMEGAYLRAVTVEHQGKKYHPKSYDYFNQDGSPEKNGIPQYKTEFGLDDEYINSLHPALFQ